MEIDPISLGDMLTFLLGATVIITTILSVAAVILLKPLSHRLGFLLEAMAQERSELRRGANAVRLQEVLDAIESRVSLLEERHDLDDALRRDPEARGRLPEGSPVSGDG